MKKILIYFLTAAAITAAVSCNHTSRQTTVADAAPQYLCIAYAWETDGPLPPADMVTGINYLAGYPNETFDGLDIHNLPRLRQILDLKKENPDLKVVLSMGGANAEAGWAEMTGNDSLRAAFVEDCRRVVDLYGLDGLDFDWEFPHGDEQVANYITLFKDVRRALGDDRLVTAAAGFWGNGFDLSAAMEHLDYINLMTYDMGWQAPYHHTAVHRSPLAGVCTLDEALDSCLAKGLSPEDIVLGLAFYGKGDNTDFKAWTSYRDIRLSDGMEQRWDSVACVPYVVDSLGKLILGYDDPQSLKIKCDYIKKKGLKGGMYWRTELDNDSLDLTRTVARELLGK